MDSQAVPASEPLAAPFEASLALMRGLLADAPALNLALEADLPRQVHAALAEDVGHGDATAALIPAHAHAQAQLRVRAPTVLCGTPWFQAVMAAVDPALQVQWQHAEGAWLAADTLVCTVHGPARSLLTAERSAMNFLQLLSGVATATRTLVDAIAQVPGNRARILDTRKTLPGLRLAQKYAVRVGGGENQRLALYDGILIKENHIAAAGGIAPALRAALLHAQAQVPLTPPNAARIRPAEQAASGVPEGASPRALSVQIEVENLDELGQALDAGARAILLDNFPPDMLAEAVRRNAGRAVLEASGGITLESVRAVAATGVDRISVGTITKDLRAADYSLRVTRVD